MTYRINDARWNSQPWNGEAHVAGIVTDVPVFYNQSSITLSWGTVPGTKFYDLQVSLFPDFRSNFIDVSINLSNYTFSDTQTNDAKRYWRWRPSISIGADFLKPWSDVGSYWLNIGAAGQIRVPEGYWVIFDKDDVNDFYFFDLSPIFSIIPRNLYRFQARNRAGTLLSEFLTIKDDVNLSFTGGQFIYHQQMDELHRFHNTKRTFFLATYSQWRHDEPIPQIWKMEFTDDPTFAMIGAGRSDIVEGSVTLTEV